MQVQLQIGRLPVTPVGEGWQEPGHDGVVDRLRLRRRQWRSAAGRRGNFIGDFEVRLTAIAAWRGRTVGNEAEANATLLAMIRRNSGSEQYFGRAEDLPEV